MNTDYYREPARDVPMLPSMDVVVCGGGPAGVGAALAAARNGARTMIIDKEICLGGMSTAGMLNRLGTQGVAPVMEGNAIKGVLIESKSGREAVMADTVIDCTGDGDMALRAGVPFAVGREEDGLTQPLTLMSKYLNMDWPRAFQYVREHHAELLEHAKALGNDFVLAGTDNWMHPEESYFNCLHMHGVNGAEANHLTRTAMELRRKLWINMEVLRRHVPGCERISLITTAAAMGVRETRRFHGAYTLTDDDVLEGRQFEDQVYRYACFVDIHEPRPGSRSRLADRSLPPGKSYGVPFRCLVPRKIENLLVAGRCLSATHTALASVHMMPSCMAMGQAAGTAAALCLKSGVPVHTAADGTATEYRFPAVSPFDAAVAFYCANISRGEQGMQSRLTGYETDALIAAIQESSAAGQAMDIAWDL